jgi:hypothetical protein
MISHELNQAFREYLDNYGYLILDGSTDDDLRFHIRTVSGSTWRSRVQLYPHKGLATWFCFLTDREYPPSIQKQVYQLADLVNDKIMMGSIVKRFDDGTILYRNTLDTRLTKPSAIAVEMFFSTGAFALALWEHSYGKLLEGKGDPGTCLTAALVELNANDSGIVTNETRRAILGVVSGGLDQEAQRIALNPAKKA